MNPIFRYSSQHISCIKSTLLPCTHGPAHLRNRPQYASTVAIPIPQYQKVKAFEELPTKHSNLWQLAFHIFRMKKQGLLKRHDLMTQQDASKYGPLMRSVMADGKFMVQISDPELIEKVFRSEGKYPERVEITPWKDYRVTRNIPLGLFLQDGKQWHRTRSAIGKRILKPMELVQHISPLVNVTKDAVTHIKRIRIKEGERKNIIPDLEEELFKWSMEGAVRVILNEQLGLLSEKVNEQSQSLINAVHEIFDTTAELFAFTHIHKRLNTKSWKRHVAGWDTTMLVTKNFIEHHVDRLMSEKEKGTEVQTDTFLGALIYNSDLTREEIYGNLSEMLLAAIDTTSYTLVWTLYFLAHNPEVQKKLREEICNVLPVDKDITKDDLSRLIYMKKVVKESMRKRPVITGISRKIDHDLILKGYHIPAKTIVALQMYPMLNDPKLFENPEEFQPERWDRNKDETPNAFASLPFGFGPRMCVGRRFAELEMHLLLADILRQFDVVPTKEVGITTRLLVIPSEPVDLKFIDRHLTKKLYCESIEMEIDHTSG